MRITQMAILAIAATVTSVALAGRVEPVPVTVSLDPDGSGSAQGDMLSARYSDNNVEFIGCGTRTSDLGDGTTFNFGFCQAADADGTMAFCFTQNAEMVAAIGASAAYSFLTFRFDADGVCTRVGHSTQSWYLPNNVQKKSKGGKK